jgi:hypothetical protein
MLLFVLWRKVLAVMVVYVAVYTTSELELSPQPPTAHYFSRRRLRHKSEQRKPVYRAGPPPIETTHNASLIPKMTSVLTN